VCMCVLVCVDVRECYQFELCGEGEKEIKKTNAKIVPFF